MFFNNRRVVGKTAPLLCTTDARVAFTRIFFHTRAYSDRGKQPIDKNTVQNINLEHVLIEKVGQLFRNML
jgi:hypothetical protein